MEKGGILKPIWLPVVVTAIVVPTALAAIFGGPGLAIVVAIVLLGAIVVIAARGRSTEPIEAPAAGDDRHRVLLAVTAPVADAAAAEAVVRAAEAGGDRPTEILALAPTRPHFLDRWAGDVAAAEAEARHMLEVTVARLRREHLDARAEIGDADIVQAVEDALGDFPADEVVLVTGPTGDDAAGAAAARSLSGRLQMRFEHVVAAPPNAS